MDLLIIKIEFDFFIIIINTYYNIVLVVLFMSTLQFLFYLAVTHLCFVLLCLFLLHGICVVRNELLGLAGKVKITNPESALTEEPVAALETSNGSAPDEIDSILITDIKHRCL